MMVGKDIITKSDDLYLKLIIESYINLIEKKLAENIVCKEKLLNLKQCLEELYEKIATEKDGNKLHFIKKAINNFFHRNKHLYNGKSNYIYNVISEMEKEFDVFNILKKVDKFLLLTYIDFIHGNENTNIKEKKA